MKIEDKLKYLIDTFDLDEVKSENDIVITKEIEKVITNNREGQIAYLCKYIKENEQKTEFVSTGFTDLDNLISGIPLGSLIVIGARPAMGKTTLLLSLALNFTLHNESKTPALFFDLELDLRQTISRLYLMLEGEMFNINTPLYLSSLNKNIDMIIERIKYNITENNVKIVFIDYIQLLEINKEIERSTDLTIAIIKLKELAKEHNIAIVISSQLNRNVEYRGGDRTPMLSDLRDSGSLEQESDMVWFINRPEYYGFVEDAEGNSTLGLANIIIAKNRLGKIGDIQLRFNNIHCKFEAFPKPKTAWNGYDNSFNYLDTEF